MTRPQNPRPFPAKTASLFLALAIAATVGPPPARADSTWLGSTIIWNAATNWSPNGIPNSSSAVVDFTDTGVGPVTITSTVSVQSLNFSNDTGKYILTSSSGKFLSGISSITVASTVTTNQTINLTATGVDDSLDFTANSNLTITNNSANGQLIIGPNTIIGTSGNFGVTFQGAGTTVFSGAFADQGTDVQVIGGLTKTGPGTLDFSGNGASLFGATVLNGGTLVLDYASSTASKSEPTAPLILNNGLLRLTPNASSAVTQSYASTTINPGHTDIQATGAGTVTLGLAAITRHVGGTVDFASPGSTTFTVTTSTVTTNNLLGTGAAYATIAGGATWATVTVFGTITGLASGSYGVNNFTSGVNTDVTAAVPVGNFTTNSLRFNTGNISLAISGTNTLQSGGILVTPSATGATVNGGTLTAPSGGELLFHVYATSNGLTVGSALVSATGLTKTGPGNLTLTAANPGLTGPVNINRGTLTITTTAAVNSASAINFNDDRTGDELQQFNVQLGDNNSGTVTPPITLSAFSVPNNNNPQATWFSFGQSRNDTVTLSGVIGSAPGLTTPITIYNTFDDSGAFYFTNTANSFTGNIQTFSSTLGITADGSLGNAANTVILANFDTGNGGLLFLNSGINVAHAVTVFVPSRIVSNGTDVNTISGLVSNSIGFFVGTLVKDGTGTLILSNPANTITSLQVQAGTLSLGTTGNVGNNATLTVNAGATFSTGGTSIPVFSTITLDGGTYRVPSGSGSNVTNQLAISTSGGTIDFTGTTSANFAFTGTTPSATIAGNSIWTSPANTSAIINTSNLTNVLFTINPGVLLTDGIAFFSPTSFGFTITGGGILYQNSDATNLGSFTAPLTITGNTTYRITDISTNGHGNLGTGTFTLDGGTLAYGGTTATTTHAIALTANGGSIRVETLATTLTINAPITGTGRLTKSGAGTLALASNVYAFSALTVEGGTLALGGATFPAATFTNNSTVTGPANFNGGSFTNNGTFTNSGLLSSNVNFTNFGTFTQLGAQTWGANTTFTNIAGSAIFTTSPGASSAGHLAITVSGGTVSLASLDNLKTLTLNGGGTTLTGVDTTTSLPTSIPIAAAATLEFAANYDLSTATAPTLTGGGTIVIDPGDSLTLRIDTPFAGSIVINGTLILAPALNPNAPTFNFSVIDAAPTPEPASLTVLALATPLLLRRHKKSRPSP